MRFFAAAQTQTSAKSAPNSAEIERAASLAETGQCADALPLLSKTLPRVSDKPARLRLGLDGVRCSMGLNDTGHALDFLRVLQTEDPHDPEVLYLSVHVFSDLSIHASQELLRTAPSSYQVHELNAEALETQGKWDEAAAEYKLVLARNPRLPGIHFRIGRLLLSKPNPAPADLQQAKQEFEDELQIDPRNAGAEYVLGELARQAMQWPDAIQHFSRATHLDSSFADAFLGLGSALVAEKEFSQAITPLETAVKLDPDNPTGHYELAIAYARVGRKEDSARQAELRKQAAEKLDENKRKIEQGVHAAGPPPGPPN